MDMICKLTAAGWVTTRTFQLFTILIVINVDTVFYAAVVRYTPAMNRALDSNQLPTSAKRCLVWNNTKHAITHKLAKTIDSSGGSRGGLVGVAGTPLWLLIALCFHGKLKKSWVNSSNLKPLTFETLSKNTRSVPGKDGRHLKIFAWVNHFCNYNCENYILVGFK